MYGRGRISLFADWPVLKYRQVPRNSRYSLYNSGQIRILYQKSLLTSCTGNFRRLYHSAIVKRSQKRSKSWARLQIADEPLRFRLHQAPRPHEFSTLFMMMSVWSRTGQKIRKAIGSAYGLCQLWSLMSPVKQGFEQILANRMVLCTHRYRRFWSLAGAGTWL